MSASSFINWYGVSDNNNQCELTNLESNKPYNCCCIFLFSPLCLSMYQVQMPEQYHLLDYFQFNNYRIVSVIRLFPVPYSFVSIKWYYKARVFFFELWHLCQFANTSASSIPQFFITIFLPWFLRPVQASGPQVYPAGSGQGPEVPRDDWCLHCNTCMQNRHAIIKGGHASICHSVKIWIRTRFIYLGNQIGQKRWISDDYWSSFSLFVETLLIGENSCQNFGVNLEPCPLIYVNYIATEQPSTCNHLEHRIDKL